MSQPFTPKLTCKIAALPEEFEAIHRLNYRTFVEEIPQHDPNREQRLVDRFHDENTYIICQHGQTLAGMVALRFQRPFSLDQKIPDLDSLLPPGQRWCEVRLLAVEPDFRGTPVLAALLRFLCRTVAERGCDAGIISATTRQLKLYRHLGFTAFGPLVGREGAWYQPMYLSIADFEKSAPVLARNPSTTDTAQSAAPQEPVSFLPGPVTLSAAVRAAMASPAVSHRADPVMQDLQDVRAALCTLTSAAHVELLFGSGTLANEAVAGQISLLNAPGIVLTNGEFSERLADHARRWRLPHAVESLPWGRTITAAEAAEALDRHPEAQWLWTTHCETSTSALNDLAGLRDLCAARGVRLCLDCVSALGVVHVDLSGVWLASCASGKGLASFPGVAMVFLSAPPACGADRLPRYLDLSLYSQHEGMPFTHSSNLIRALKASLTTTDWQEKMNCIARLSRTAEQRLSAAGCRMISQDQPRNPAVLTLEIPAHHSSLEFADRMEAAGYLLSCRSAYLSRRNWVQICLMGEVNAAALDGLCSAIEAEAPWSRTCG